jgi:recombination protein RecT
MTKAEVDAHRKRSAAKDSGPWVTDYDAMGKKTVIRVLCSQIPLNAEAQQAIAADETAVVFDGDEGVIEVSEAPVIDVEPEPEQEVGADG